MENRQCQVLNAERVKALEAWVIATHTKLSQVNGQRKYGGPPEVWHGPPPGARCEVFISQIPRDAYEDLLIPLFGSVGPLWEFRLMMNFSGQNRGFAYAKYGTAATATDAIRQLHGFVLEPGFRLNVRRSTEKRHLCIGELPVSTRREALLQVLRGLADGVQSVSLTAGPGIEGVSAVVAFSSHHAASMAKKVLVEGFKKQFSQSVSIDWHSAEKMSPEDSVSAHRSPRSLARLPRPAPSPSVPPGFCRAPGGPAAHMPPPARGPPAPPGRLVDASPVALLQKMCAASGLGPPLYQTRYSGTGRDGFLHFRYEVRIPGAPATFTGLLMILPGPTASVLREAERAAAQRVLQELNHKQVAA
ncbi:dead end protein 1 [Menidia menidia]